MVEWVQFSIKASASQSLRRELQESLIVILELDGLLANVLGSKYRKWKRIRILRQLLAENKQQQALIQITNAPPS